MALGKAVSEFTIKFTSFTYTPGPGALVNFQCNYEGTAPGFDWPFLGTVSGAGAGQKSGTMNWCAVSFPENGESLTVNGQGTFEKIDANRWRTRGISYFSDSHSYALEGEWNLAERSWNGTLYEWN